MTRIGVEGMEFYAFHGYYEAERKMGSKFLVDVYVNLRSELKDSEDIDDTVNYEKIYEVCREEMLVPRELLETVVYKIVERLKKRFKIIKSVDVKLVKVGAQLGGKVKQAVIEYSN